VSAVRILEPGFRSTVQDAGRWGHLRSAVPAAGPADPLAFEAARLLVGNAPDDAAIEIVGLPFRFVLDTPRLIAVAGPGVSVRSRGTVSGSTSVFVRAGEEVAIEGTARFAYLAISGGITVPPVLGSRATYVPARLGPIPRPLSSTDELPLGPARNGAESAGARLPSPERRDHIRITRGPYADRSVQPSALTRGPYRVSERSDRMGVRLEGLPVETSGGEILSIGVLPGAVQIPRGGEPIVLLADHQTTGGYPVVACVIRADLGQVAQARPGEELSFVEVEVGAAVDALREERRRLGLTLR
jgi:biotin-dependent carboxylase-like uncharacterized protein